MVLKCCVELNHEGWEILIPVEVISGVAPVLDSLPADWEEKVTGG